MNQPSLFTSEQAPMPGRAMAAYLEAKGGEPVMIQASAVTRNGITTTTTVFSDGSIDTTRVPRRR